MELSVQRRLRKTHAATQVPVDGHILEVRHSCIP
jgi:hypothetical protein